jgi:DNA adenine methylase
MLSPLEALNAAYQAATEQPDLPRHSDPAILRQIAYLCHSPKNRAPARLLIAALAAKIAYPHIDIRKPYTEIGGADTYSGRAIDEGYVTAFIQRHQLPLNYTTAFLTPAFRNRNTPLTVGLNMSGRPAALYAALLDVLEAVAEGRITPEAALTEAIRQLLIVKRGRQERVAALQAALSPDGNALSVEAIIDLLRQHFALPRSSRLPVLAVAAVYHVAQTALGERILPLSQYNAADSQTGALGDLEITLIDNQAIITVYEVKARQIRIEDIDHALEKIHNSGTALHRYLFITTEPVDDAVARYTKSIYVSSGIEIAVLDCLTFIRHFLHLFHRLRMTYLNAYQALLLQMPESTAEHSIKEAFLTLRRAAEIKTP